MNIWISVEDKDNLPEANKPVLCFCEYQNVFQEHIKWTGQSIGRKNGYNDDFILDNNDTAFARITHWMPLPDDPK